MAGGKETPRQKMIGMMYLVLTALLALNVSKEIINAFVKLDSKLMDGNTVLVNKSEGIMAEFDKAMALPANKAIVKPIQEQAIQLRKMAYEMDKYINIDCKNKLLKEVEKKDFMGFDDKTGRCFYVIPLNDVESKDEYDAPTRLFGGEPGTEGFNNGAALREKIHKFRDDLMVFVSIYEFNGKKFKYNPANVKDSASLEAELLTNVYNDDKDRVRAIYKTLTLPETIREDNEDRAWQLAMFDHAPIVAAAALFSALSNDVRSAEGLGLEILQSRVKVPTFNFNKIEPLAYARTSYLNVGDSMRVRAMIAAYDSTEVPDIKFAVNDSNPANFTAITGDVPIRATSPGEYTVYGQIGVKEKGIVKYRAWRYKYEVGEPMGVVANEDLTVIYAGYDHTFSASASGYPQDKISLSLPGVSVSPKGGGKFSVKAPVQMQGKAVQSSISVKVEGGSKSFQGPKFIVKQLPKPSSFFGSIPSSESNVTKAQLSGNMGVGVRAGYDPSVPLDPSKVSFRVTGFEMVVNVGGNIVRKTANSGQLTAEMKQTMGALRSGMSVSFASIKAVGPAGEVRVNPLVFIIK